MARQDPYLYEDVQVLRNLPGIQNSDELEQAVSSILKRFAIFIEPSSVRSMSGPANSIRFQL